MSSDEKANVIVGLDIPFGTLLAEKVQQPLLQECMGLAESRLYPARVPGVGAHKARCMLPCVGTLERTLVSPLDGRGVQARGTQEEARITHLGVFMPRKHHTYSADAFSPWSLLGP
jgi:hypothetical protein